MPLLDDILLKGDSMEYFQGILRALIGIFIILALIKLLMEAANYIGEKLGFGSFFEFIKEKLKKKN